MNLRAYYYQKYGNEFEVFEHFIRENGLKEDFLEFLEVSIDYLEDKEFPLYDYFFASIDFFYLNNKDQNYDFLFFKKIIDEKFIKFCISEEGKEIINETHLYFGGKAIDIFDVIYNSRENFTEDSYPSIITNREYFRFLDKYIEIKYLKEVKILSMLRTFIDNGGFGGEFYDIADNNDLLPLISIVMSGDFRTEDNLMFESNIDEFKNILEIVYIDPYEHR